MERPLLFRRVLMLASVLFTGLSSLAMGNSLTVSPSRAQPHASSTHVTLSYHVDECGGRASVRALCDGVVILSGDERKFVEEKTTTWNLIISSGSVSTSSRRPTQSSRSLPILSPLPPRNPVPNPMLSPLRPRHPSRKPKATPNPPSARNPSAHQRRASKRSESSARRVCATFARTARSRFWTRARATSRVGPGASATAPHRPMRRHGPPGRRRVSTGSRRRCSAPASRPRRASMSWWRQRSPPATAKPATRLAACRTPVSRPSLSGGPASTPQRGWQGWRDPERTDQASSGSRTPRVGRCWSRYSTAAP